MKFKNILFVMTFTFVLSSHSFNTSDFLRKQSDAKKSGFAKIALGTACAAPSYVESNSLPLNVAQLSGALIGSVFIVTGLYQILVDTLAEKEVQESLYPSTPHFDKSIRTIITHPEFIAGAAFTLTGLFLECAKETNQVSDTSLVATAIGFALVAKVTGKELLPKILAHLNK